MMKMKIWFLAFASVLTVVLMQSCYYDKADLLYPNSNQPCDTTVVAKFSADVMPVMTNSCNAGGCHNTTSASSGVILDTYAGVKTQALNGRLIASIDHTNGTMPKGGAKLSTCTITKIQQWINSGTPNN
jgi:hypothetical protein